MRESKLGGYLPMIFLFVIPRSVNIITINKGRRRVVHHAGWGENGLLIGNSVVNGRSIHKRLENRAGWPLGYSVIQLAETVIASANQRQDLAGVRIERN